MSRVCQFLVYLAETGSRENAAFRALPGPLAPQALLAVAEF